MNRIAERTRLYWRPAAALAFALWCMPLALAGAAAASEHVARADSVPGKAAEKAAPVRLAQASKTRKPVKKDLLSAQSDVETGIKALNAGNAKLARAKLTSGLSAGKLPPAQTARALYYRGLSYRKLRQDALAIADLTSALWLKDGLKGKQRERAIAERDAAYKAAGVAAPAKAPTRTAASPKMEAPEASVPGRRVAKLEPSGFGNLFGSWFGGGGGSGDSEPKPETTETTTTPAAPRKTALASWSSGTEVKTAARTGSIAPRRAPPRSPPRPSAFTTTVTPPPVPRASGRPERPPVRSAATAPPRAVPRSMRAVPAQVPGRGRIQLRVASLKTREAAQALAQRLKSRYGRSFAIREASIREATTPDNAKVYQVQFAPFASQAEARALCPRLKRARLGCQIITN